MDLNEALRQYWTVGHYSFCGDDLHTDRRFYCRDGEGLRIIDEALLPQLEAANPGQIFEMIYEDGFSWMRRILPQLQQRLGHKVQLIEFSKPPKYVIRGRTILFVEVVSLGMDGLFMGMVVRPQFWPTEIHGVLDRSIDGFSHLDGMRVRTAFRQKTNIWLTEDCPLCLAGVPIDVSDLARG